MILTRNPVNARESLGYVKDVYSIPHLVESLSPKSENQVVFLDTSVFSPPTRYLEITFQGRRDYEALENHAWFYNSISPIVANSSVLLPHGVVGELMTLLMHGRVALLGDKNCSAVSLDRAIDILSRTVSRKQPHNVQNMLAAVVREMADSKSAPHIDRLYNLCSNVDRKGVSSALEVASEGRKTALATRDSAQEQLLRRAIKGTNASVCLLCYDEDSQIYMPYHARGALSSSANLV